MSRNFATITEQPEQGASAEQLDMLYTRYSFAASFCQDKDVMEVGCGAGLGLGFLSRRAKSVVGGDVDIDNIELSRKRNKGKIPLVRLDAQSMPMKDSSFDVIVFFEAIYYLERPKEFVAECWRVLRPEGRLLVSSVNREWVDFNPSPFSKKYFSAMELSSLVQEAGFRCNLLGGFPVDDTSAKKRILSIIKRGAMALGLMPKTMKGKAFLKRIFYGKTTRLPPEITDKMATFQPLTPLILENSAAGHKMLYLEAQKKRK